MIYCVEAYPLNANKNKNMSTVVQHYITKMVGKNKQAIIFLINICSSKKMVSLKSYE